MARITRLRVKDNLSLAYINAKIYMTFKSDPG